jgi:hypothetical protein
LGFAAPRYLPKAAHFLPLTGGGGSVAQACKSGSAENPIGIFGG